MLARSSYRQAERSCVTCATLFMMRPLFRCVELALLGSVSGPNKDSPITLEQTLSISELSELYRDAGKLCREQSARNPCWEANINVAMLGSLSPANCQHHIHMLNSWSCDHKIDAQLAALSSQLSTTNRD